MANYKIITGKTTRKYNRRVSRAMRKDRRRARWELFANNVRAKCVAWLIQKRAKKVVKKLRKIYARKGEHTFTLQPYEITRFDIAPVLEFLASRKVLKYKQVSQDSPEQEITLL